VINDKSQGSVAAQLRCGGCLPITLFCIYLKFGSEKKFKSVNT